MHRKFDEVWTCGLEMSMDTHTYLETDRQTNRHVHHSILLHSSIGSKNHILNNMRYVYS